MTVEDINVEDTPATETGARTPLAQRLAAAAGAAWATLTDAFGVFEWVTTLGAVMLLAGLWLWFGAGPALTVVGGIVLVLGIAGGRAAAAAVSDVVVDDQEA